MDTGVMLLGFLLVVMIVAAMVISEVTPRDRNDEDDI